MEMLNQDRPLIGLKVIRQAGYVTASSMYGLVASLGMMAFAPPATGKVCGLETGIEIDSEGSSRSPASSLVLWNEYLGKGRGMICLPDPFESPKTAVSCVSFADVYLRKFNQLLLWSIPSRWEPIYKVIFVLRPVWKPHSRFCAQDRDSTDSLVRSRLFRRAMSQAYA